MKKKVRIQEKKGTPIVPPIPTVCKEYKREKSNLKTEVFVDFSSMLPASSMQKDKYMDFKKRRAGA